MGGVVRETTKEQEMMYNAGGKVFDMVLCISCNGTNEPDDGQFRSLIIAELHHEELEDKRKF
jgi:hypothetical protein